jgi:hypothetical protein
VDVITDGNGVRCAVRMNWWDTEWFKEWLRLARSGRNDSDRDS